MPEKSFNPISNDIDISARYIKSLWTNTNTQYSPNIRSLEYKSLEYKPTKKAYKPK